jgi:CubicO group peptidase (beta-lactamase class C family)
MLILSSLLYFSMLALASIDEQQPLGKSIQVDNIFNSIIKPDAPGAAVMIIRDGKVLHRKGYGLANLELDVPVTPKTKFRLCSLSKQFTAMAIMQLHDRGLLDMDDPVIKYLPDCIKWEGVTIRHLLNHTSGITSFPKPKSWQEPYTFEKMIETFKDEPLEFNPGERFSYSNNGYDIMGYIIEKVTGKTYETYMKENIFEPLGMMDSGCDYCSPIIRSRASGYEFKDDEPVNPYFYDTSLLIASGGLYSTAEDMYLWDQALYTEKLVKALTLEQAFTPGKLNDGSLTSYGFGWMIHDYFGLRELDHLGGQPGFSSYIGRYIDQRFTVIILSNDPRLKRVDIAHKILDIYIPDKLNKGE